MRPAARTDRGSLPLAMLLTIVGAGLSAVVLSSVLHTVADTRSEQGRAASLMAARSGLNSAVGSFKSAVDADGAGQVQLLPCPAAGVPHLAGSAGMDGTAYTVTVYYLAENPKGRGEAWARANGVRCAGQLVRSPQFAFVSSRGTSSNTHPRTLTAVFSFKTAVQGPMPGGQVRVLRQPGDLNDLCVDAGALPAAGVVVRLQPCVAATQGSAVPRQRFAYQPNLTLSYEGGNVDRSVYPYGLCLQAGWPQAAGQQLILRPCGAATRPEQMWSFNFASSFIGTDDGRTVNDVCWSVETPDTPGSRILLNDTAGGLANGNPRCNTSFPNNSQSWNIASDVGTGASGPHTRQLVNFALFSRCLDQYQRVTEQWVFPCKQNPDPSIRDWNQVWFLPDAGARGMIHHDRTQNHYDVPTGPYCLQMPPYGTTPARTRVVACDPADPAPPADLTWLVRGADAQTYDERYRIEGTGAWAGYCLTPLMNEPSLPQGKWTGLERCTGSYLQKWNAEPPSAAADLGDVEER